MRRAKDFIAELEEEARKHWFAMMVVGAGNSTVFIQAKDDNRLALLNSALSVGSTPVGLIVADISLQTRPYFERELEEPDEFDPENYLRALKEHVRRSFLYRS
jgi:hypothetical protein